jgi:peptidoglycan/LPS O-acetylase OafA/YrhL
LDKNINFYQNNFDIIRLFAAFQVLFYIYIKLTSKSYIYNNIIVFIGKISFLLYLIHFIKLGKYVTGKIL